MTSEHVEAVVAKWVDAALAKHEPLLAARDAKIRSLEAKVAELEGTSDAGQARSGHVDRRAYHTGR